jgi:plasmid stabilization system protein ParE
VTQVIVRPAAAADIEEAYDWYEIQRPGLGEEFLTALRSTLNRVIAQPEAFAVIHRTIRRALIPYASPTASSIACPTTRSSWWHVCTRNAIHGGGRGVRDGGSLIPLSLRTRH